MIHAGVGVERLHRPGPFPYERALDRAAGTASERTWAICAAYTAVFAVFAFRWLRVAANTIPAGPLGNPTDERLVVALLAWGTRALSHPAELFQFPINHPAPDQLTGSEHLLSTQLVFAPIFRLTGNPVLAANVGVFLAYPLGATAMYWLLRLLGCDRLVAFAGGFALALGAAQVPAQLHHLQYLVLFFPLIAGTLTSLRLEPSMRRATAVLAVATIASSSSYYTFVLTAFVAVIWALGECLRPGAGRARFVVLAGGSLVVPAMALAALSLPYLRRPETALALAPLRANPLWPSLAIIHSYTGTWMRLLAVLGLCGLVSRSAAARTSARRGLTIAALGAVLMLGPGLQIDGRDVPLPYALIGDSPLRFIRYPFRFVGMLAFGRALLMASALQTARSVLPQWLGAPLVVAATAAIVMLRAPLIDGERFDVIGSARHPVYDLVARATDGAGPLLELPLATTHVPSAWSDGDALVGQIRHGLPLIAGHTGYVPPHRPLIDRAIAALPAPAAAQTLVELTHLRWILLRPATQWPKRGLRHRKALLRARWASVAARLDGWVLLRVRLVPTTHDFYSGIKRGWRPGFTVVGTPSTPIAAADAAAAVAADVVTSTRKVVGLRLTVTNRGRRTWPVTVPVFTTLPPSYRGEVYVQATWRRTDPGAHSLGPIVHELPLPIDVRRGRSVTFPVLEPVPEEPGIYELELAVRQRNGEGFAPPASRVARRKLDLR